MTEYKTFEVAEVKVIDEAQGIVEALTNSMGLVDSDNDVIDTGAFQNSIANNMPVTVLLGHDASKVVGKVIDAREINTGSGTAKLYNKIQFNLDTQLGRDTFSNVAGGYSKEWSVGFNIPEGGAEFANVDGFRRRYIKDVDWVEVSSVIRGASPNTGTLSAKSDNNEITEPETESADDSQPIIAEAFVPSTPEVREQVLRKLEEQRIRQLTHRLKNSISKKG